MSKKNRKQHEAVHYDAADQQDGGPGPNAPQRPVQVGAIDPESWLEDVVPLALGVLAVVLARAVEPGIRDLFQLPKQLYMAVGAAISVGLVGGLAALGRPMRFRSSPLVWSGLAFIAAILVSLLIAPRHTGGMLSIFARYDAHRWLAAAAVFWATLMGVRQPRHVWYLVGGLLVGGLVVSLIGIGEQHNILGLLPEKRWASISKPGSTFGNRNMAAEVVVSMLPAAYVGLAAGLRSLVHGQKFKGIALLGTLSVVLLTLAYYVMLTVTRSAWLGALMGVVGAAVVWTVGVLLAKRDVAQISPQTEETESVREAITPPKVGLFGVAPKTVLVPLAAVMVVAGGVGMVADRLKPAEEIEAGDVKLKKSVPELLKSFTEFGSNHYRWRFGMLASSWAAIKAEPLGGGAGNWRVIYPAYLQQREKNEMFTIAKQPIRAHNDILQIGVEYGWHGLLAFFAILASAGWLAIRVVRRAAAVQHEHAKPGEINREGAALLAFAAMGSLMGILAILGDAQASFPLQLPVPTFLFALHLGVIAAADGILAPRSTDATEAKRLWPSWQSSSTMGGAVLALMFLQGFGNYQGLHERWMVAEHGFTDARNLQKSGRAQQGVIEIRKAIAQNPDDFQNHFIEALCLNSMGRTKEAIDSLYNSLKLYPNLLNAWVNVAMFSARIGDTARMNEAIDKALALKPDELVALNVRLAYQNQHDEPAKTLELVAKQFKGYEDYRASGNWPVDDGGQLLGAYKQTLNHAITAARKLDKPAELAMYLKVLDDLGIPNDGRTDEAKQVEKRDRAADIAKALLQQKLYADALPWARKAAELSKNGHAELKRQYAVTLAWNGQFDEAAHEGRVARRVDKGETAKLIADFKAVQASGKVDAAKVAALIALFETPPAPPAPSVQ